MSRAAIVSIPLDPIESARRAHLRYVSDATPGITRRRRGKGFKYYRADGSIVRDASTLKRIAALAIPPAWEDVWISTDANGHIQATGRDARGRKQYRYHAHWRLVRDDTKYGRMIAFGQALSAIRKKAEADLKAAPLSRDRRQHSSGLPQMLHSSRGPRRVPGRCHD